MTIRKIEILNDFLDITKALADETRVRAFVALKNGELCLCQIVELLGLAQSTVSKHMSILKKARLVESRKEGKWVYFRLTEKRITPMIKSTFSWVFSLLEHDTSTREMQKKIHKITAIDLKEICRKVNEKMGKIVCSQRQKH
ncbi:MAG: winged helix-turn-helix transcriptional regulator [Candidatus Riflebacteria bacterium]|nr:winged helix-turn-helix transcriptional regulator [Candidatus Riflebacteria bacterium]